MNLSEYEQMQPHIDCDGIVFMTPNTHCAWRVETLLSKEPDTIAWIKNMKAGEILYDIGANMGQYSLYAAKRGVIVQAFEPESQNFALMCRNIAMNSMSDKITPWPLAVSDFCGLAPFHVTTLTAGNSCNSFDEEVNFHLEAKKFAFTQGSFGTTLDEFVLHHTSPNHIKIDVDGLEHRVLKGADHVLHYVDSVLVETNTHLEEHNAISTLMNSYGLHPDLETAEIARRKDGPFKGIGNVIYFRKTDNFLSRKAEK